MIFIAQPLWLKAFLDFYQVASIFHSQKAKNQIYIKKTLATLWNSILVCEGYTLWHLLSVWKYIIKGQEISECKYEVVALPKIWTKKIEKFCPKNFFVHILGNARTSYFLSEISWPLEQMQIKITTLTVSIPLRIESQVFLKSYFGFSKPLWIRKHPLKFTE